MKQTLLITAGMLSLACGTAQAEGGCSYGQHQSMAELAPPSNALLAQTVEPVADQAGVLYREHAADVDRPERVIHN